MNKLILLFALFAFNAFAGAVGDNTGTHDVGLGNATPNYMPFVDRSKYLPWKGWRTRGTNELWVRASTKPTDIATAGLNGEFRIDCEVSHMSNDDPILYPRQKGKAHSHTFFGNTSTYYLSSATSLMAKDKNGNCRGGAANKSAYWIPSMIDTETGTPLVPKGALWYYKSGFVDGAKIQVPPNGLKIIAGNAKATSPQSARFPHFNCMPLGDKSGRYLESKSLPACGKGGAIVSKIEFPQCWDGKNLDSPDHISHMANPSGGNCPATHPVPIPHLSLNVYYDVPSDKGTEMWRLASDNYPKNGYNAGYSSHADWIAAWHTPTITKIVKQCLNKKLECGNSLLGFTEGVGHEIIYKSCNINGVVRDC